MIYLLSLYFFFFNDPAPTEIYPLPLHDALPIFPLRVDRSTEVRAMTDIGCRRRVFPRHAIWIRWKRTETIRIAQGTDGDRKSTRLNSSHGYISYAVFCLKKKEHITCLLTSIIIS